MRRSPTNSHPLLLLLLAFLIGLAGFSCDDVGSADPGDDVLDTLGDGDIDPEPLCGEETCEEGEECCGDACVALDSSQDHCGACGAVCEQGEACDAGACVCENANGSTSACEEGALCCPEIGCVDASADVLHCGGCGITCGAGERCEDGACVCGDTQGESGAACESGLRCCQGACVEPDDATCVCGDSLCIVGQDCCDEACVFMDRDEENCGACGVTCGDGQLCRVGACSCISGQADCDGDQENGCETRILSDSLNCGGCGISCEQGEVCSQGECMTTCPSGEVACEGNCVDLYYDRANCGACGNECVAGEVCSGGSCAPACEGELISCAGICVDSQIDRLNCGACGRECPVGEICWDGICSLNCPDGLGRCGDSCVDLDYDGRNCGVCGLACESDQVCVGGACETDCPSELTDCLGTCVDTDGSRFHCGGCGVSCGFSEDCVDGGCLAQCPEGQFYCGERCVDPMTSESYCGSAGCEDPSPCGNGQTCVTGECACDAGFGDCNGDPADGCEGRLPTDEMNCGSCGIVCEPGETCCNGTCADREWDRRNCGTCGNVCPLYPDTNPRCDAGVCSFTCLVGHGDCDGVPENGCEDNLDTVNHCGSCGNICASINGSASCVSGGCQLACSDGWADCDGDPSNGCEQALDEISHCGSCGNVCAPINGSAACLQGSCSLSCDEGFEDCNGLASDGCEADMESPLTCGDCDYVCSTFHAVPLCIEGWCEVDSCDPGWGDCGDGGIEMDRSKAVGDGFDEWNDGCETNLMESPYHCGACYNECWMYGTELGCNAGSCEMTGCWGGFGDCDTNPDNGCEVQLNSNSNCGACGNVCNPVNGTAECVNQACEFLCDPGWADCDGDPSNGCEQDLMDPDHCGACGEVCAAINGTADCSEGCILFCDPDFEDCNGDPSDGCETDLNSPDSCGYCENVCSDFHAVPLCDRGWCDVESCDPGWGNCGSMDVQMDRSVVVEADFGAGFESLGELPFVGHYTTQNVMVPAHDKPLTLRLSSAKGITHLDLVTLAGAAATEVHGADADKLSGLDHDVQDLTASFATFIFPPSASPRNLEVNARIEPDEIVRVPFQYPPENTWSPVEEAATGAFYKYAIGSNPVAFTRDGQLNEELGEPLFGEFIYCGTGHPQGDTFGWVGDDGVNLYVAMDFTSDNTMDGEEDYAQVLVKNGAEVLTYTSRVGETQWGTPGFTYTDKVSYQHKIYEFGIPLAELPSGPNLSLSFTAYGTAGPGMNDGCETDLMDSVMHCGACDNECWMFGTEMSCDMGSCVPLGCWSGYEDCDGNPDNGCEFDTWGGERSCPEPCVDCGGDWQSGRVVVTGSCNASCMYDNWIDGIPPVTDVPQGCTWEYERAEQSGNLFVTFNEGTGIYTVNWSDDFGGGNMCNFGPAEAPLTCDWGAIHGPDFVLVGEPGTWADGCIMEVILEQPT